MSKIHINDDLQNQPNEKLEAIRKLFPDCFDADNNLISQKLQEVLTHQFPDAEKDHFIFNWAGKQKAREIAHAPYNDGTFEFCPEKSKNFAETQNLIIESDNLQALKLLRKSYRGKVKCIYIDPPYNTGNDFVYNDKFELNIKEYIKSVEGNDEAIYDQLTKESGKKHSKWLSFMFPRLVLARELLREDGVIFISIDDNEQANLRLLMNEVFGEGEFVGCLKWKRKKQPSFLASHIANVMEYVLVYSKDCDLLEKLSIETVSDLTKKVINVSNNYSSRVFKAGVRVKGMESGIIKADKYTIKTMDIEYKNDIVVQNGITQNEVEVYARFSTNQDSINNFIDNNLLFITKNFGLRRDVSEEELKKQKSITDLLLDEWGDNQESENEIFELFQNRDVFDFPKPVNLIKNLTKACTAPNDLILDFFAGSGTTAQAVMELNFEETQKAEKDGLLADGKPTGGRKFILVQLPEKISEKQEAFKAGYRVISDITMERVRRAGEKYKGVDVGFKALKLTQNPDAESLWNLGNLQDSNFILTHLALYYGYGLNFKAEKIAEREIYLLKSEFEGVRPAVVILERELLKMEDIMALIQKYGKQEFKFFARDCSLNIELTYNLLQHFKEESVVVF